MKYDHISHIQYSDTISFETKTSQEVSTQSRRYVKFYVIAQKFYLCPGHFMDVEISFTNLKLKRSIRDPPSDPKALFCVGQTPPPPKKPTLVSGKQNDHLTAQGHSGMTVE